MSVFQIREAQRQGARIVLGISGISGSGKTYTALQLAWGLANGDARKVGFLDTENRRGSLYADILKRRDGTSDRFLIGDLDAPFSPERYVEGILEFQKAGVEVLVIDSVSHEWNGLGGVLETVDAATKSIHGWKAATPAHRRFMNVMLQSDMHIIACVRASQKTDWKDPKNPKPLGLMPVQRDDFMFEMTASMMMWDGGRSRDVMKCPEDLVPILGNVGRNDGFLTAKQGLAIRKWVDGGATLDAKAEHARNTLRSVAERGVDAVNAAWKGLGDDACKALGNKIPEEVLKSAQAFDRAREVKESGGEEIADLNAQLQAEGGGAVAAE